MKAIRWADYALKYAVAICIILAAILSPAVFAATADLSWTAPATRVDGSAIGPAEIAEYRVFYEIDAPVTETSSFAVVTTGTAETITLDLTPRAEPYTVNFAVMTVDAGGRTSVFSETVSKTFDVDSTAKPSPPTSVQVTFSCGDGCTIQEIVK